MKQKKEFKQLEPHEIVSRVKGFLESQRLEGESQYFILKQCLEDVWSDIRIDDDSHLGDFYDDEDYADDDEDVEEEYSINEEDDVDVAKVLDDVDVAKVLDDVDDFESVDDLLTATDEEETVKASKKKKGK